MTRQDLDFIADVLARAVTAATQQTRLQKGTELRQQIVQALSTGQPCDHYRIKWTAGSVNRVIDFVQELCREFDAAHPDDMASAQDVLDILRGAISVLSQQVQAFSKKEE